MNSVGRLQVLKLYKDLLRYGQQLKYTDKEYFSKRIRKEFEKNRNLEAEEEINLNFERSNCASAAISGLTKMIDKAFSILKPNTIISFCKRFKVIIDYSRVPVLKDDELEEKFVRGSGPGGQKINKTSSAVCLKHIPTGIVIKCHQSRSLVQNRKTARSLLTTRLDNLINGENSVENQKKALEAKKHSERHRRRNKLRELKEEWKKNQTDNKEPSTTPD